MAISSSDITAGPYSTNNATTNFTFAFRVASYGGVDPEDQIKVVLVTTATGAETVLTRGAGAGQYSVSINADQDAAPGGSITTVTTYASGYTIYIRLAPVFTQATDLANGATFYANALESQFDQLFRQTLEIYDRLRRSPVLGVQAGESFNGEITGSISGKAGYLPAINDAGTGFALVANNGSSNLVTATGSTTARSLAARYAEILNVKDYGAVGDGSTDDTAAINAAFTALRALVDELEIGDSGYLVYFPPGKYKVTSSINATGIRNLKWGIIGPGEIIGDFTSAYAVLDLTFSRFALVRDLLITSGTGVPGIGVLVSVDNSGNVADSHNFDNVAVRGTFSIACLYNYGSEDFSGHHIQLYNAHNNANSACLLVDGTNSKGATSPFRTINANTAVSMNDVHFDHLDCRKTVGGPAIFLRRTAGLGLMNSYAVSYDDAAIVVSSDAFGHQNLALEVHCETTGLTTCVRFDGDSSSVIIKGFLFHDYAPYASSEVFKAGSGVTSVTLWSVDIRIPTFNTNPSNNVFNTASYFHILGGRVFVGDVAYLNEASIGTARASFETSTTSRLRQLTSASFASGATFDFNAGDLTWTHSANAFQFTGGVYTFYRDDSATASTLSVEQDGSGDAILRWILTGTRAWIGGIDNSDSDSFKLSPLDDAFAAAVFTLTTGGTLSISTAYQVNGVKVIGAQGAAVADASGGATIDTEARTAINALLARLRAHGLIAT